MNQTNHHRIEELDALRGIAALMIVLFHYTLKLTHNSYFIFKLGITGVDLFFLISGFVIYMSLTKIKNGTDFIINRLSRLYPTYWVCVSVTFVFYLFQNSDSLSLTHLVKYFNNLTMFQIYLDTKYLDESYWTMVIEMLFYMSILFLFQFNLLKYINVIGIGLSIITVILTHYFFHIKLVEKIIYYIPLLQFLPLFFAGIILYKIYTKDKKLIQNYLILLLCICCQILLFQFAGKSRYLITHTEYGIMLTLYFTLFILFVNHKLKFIVSKITLFIGEISFALYLIHQYISTEVIIPFLVNQLHLNFWIASLLISLPLMILLASFITYYLEKPLSKKMKEKLRSLKSNKKVPNLSV